MMIRPFHVAFPVSSLAHVDHFYGEVLGCSFGRRCPEWVDVDFFGHQVVFHKVEGFQAKAEGNGVDGKHVPVPHFGVILTPSKWESLATRVQSFGVTFLIEPHTRFLGQPGEQSTMFFADPEGYHLEFKAFADDAMIFAK